MFSIAPGTAWLFCILTLPGVVDSGAEPTEPPRIVASRQATSPQSPAAKPMKSDREYFVSWGYNGSGFTKSDMHFSQPSLGNNFTLAAVQARDSKGWNSQLFTHGLFVPQYNVRIGFFFNDKWGLELALDHIKWIVRQGQQVQMTGTLDGDAVDNEVTLTPEVLRYQLNNGANPFFVNVVRRVRLAREPGQTGHVAVMAKAGAGFAFPHTENAVFDEPNVSGFQFFHGWDLDAGVAVRVHIFKPLYFEFEQKLVYARYFGVKIADGTASHSMKASEYTFNFGLSFK